MEHGTMKSSCQPLVLARPRSFSLVLPALSKHGTQVARAANTRRSTEKTARVSAYSNQTLIGSPV